jgi:hypothetical protein
MTTRQWRFSKARPRHYGKRPDPRPPVATPAELMKQIEARNRALAEAGRRGEKDESE